LEKVDNKYTKESKSYRKYVDYSDSDTDDYSYNTDDTRTTSDNE
jgi:hypothetical protein